MAAANSPSEKALLLGGRGDLSPGSSGTSPPRVRRGLTIADEGSFLPQDSQKPPVDTASLSTSQYTHLTNMTRPSGRDEEVGSRLWRIVGNGLHAKSRADAIRM